MSQDIDETEEKDTKMLTYSLLGIIKSSNKKDHEEHVEGLKLMEKARDLSSEMGTLYERKKWMAIPEIQLQIIN